MIMTIVNLRFYNEILTDKSVLTLFEDMISDIVYSATLDQMPLVCTSIYGS